MNRFGILSIRQRLGAVVTAVVAAFACCAIGALMTFVMAPGQAVQATRISRMPIMDAAAVAASAPGDAILVTGVLAGNAPLLDNSVLVAYTEQAWDMTDSDPEGDEGLSTTGRWESRGIAVPDLTLEVNGAPVTINSASRVAFSGSLREEIVLSDSPDRASYQGELIPNGSQRFRGLADGDLTTVLGVKHGAGGINPEHLYAGTRDDFQQSQRQSAGALLVAGILFMLFSPVVLIGGALAALFRRR